MFVHWPSRKGMPPKSWGGTHTADPSVLGLSEQVRREIATVTTVVAKLKPLAFWLSGSTARAHMRLTSDIDWVIVADHKVAVSDGWPSARHVYHFQPPETF